MQVIAILCIGLAVVVIYEVVGQCVFTEERLWFINDVDHRLKPESGPDINSDGIRSLVDAGGFRKDDLNIILLGDSFVYGYWVEIDRSIPLLLEEKAQAMHPDRTINVANFGWISSSPLLSLRLLQDIGYKYDPDLVILAIDMGDFHDEIKHYNLIERKGIYRGLGFAPVTVWTIKKICQHVKPLHAWLFRLPSRRFFMTDKPLAETLPLFSYMRRSVDDMNRFTREELGAGFMVVVFPQASSAFGYAKHRSVSSVELWEGWFYGWKRPWWPRKKVE